MNKRIFSLMVLACCLGAAKCQPSPVQPTPEVGGAGSGGVGGSVMVDGGTSGTSGTSGAPSGGAAADDCGKAEAKALAAGCPLKKPKRASWAEVCRVGRANGVDMQDDCVLKAADCAAIHKCTSESAP